MEGAPALAKLTGEVVSLKTGDLMLPRAASFWLLAWLLMFFLFAASAPSPLYPVYQAAFGFPPITLTAVYAAYAFGALGALLTCGRLSDHVGRRRVVAVALVTQIAGMIVFIVAQGVEALFLARIVQGVGTGIASGALSAWLLDLQPLDDRRLGGVVGGIAPVAGLAAGGLGSGLLVQFAPDPLHLVFWLLTAVYAAALAAMVVIPDPVVRTPGWLRSMRPEFGVPLPARPLFIASAPSLIAVWAVAGFYLSLGPLLAVALIGSDSRIAGGLVIAALLGAGAVASALTQTASPRLAAVRGSLLLIAGVATSLLAVAIGSTVGLYAGSVIAGLGLGPAFSGVLRGLAQVAPPDKRAALFASVYVVIYLSFSIPAIIAGAAVGGFGLRATTYAYGLVVIVLAALTIAAVSRRAVPAKTVA